MASVHLRFTAPPREGLAFLHIYESVNPTGPWTEIEVVAAPAIGSYPDYISEYSTDQAVSGLDYFAIQWEDDKGALTEISNGVQGGTDSFVSEIIDLVYERDTSLDKQVVRQETEVAVEDFFGRDPYTVDGSKVNYRTKVGLARLVQARTLVNVAVAQAASSAVATSAGGWTAGLVSMKGASSSEVAKTASANSALIRWLLEEASRALGLNFSRIAQMAGIEIAGGFSEIVSADISRLQIEVE